LEQAVHPTDGITDCHGSKGIPVVATLHGGQPGLGGLALPGQGMEIHGNLIFGQGYGHVPPSQKHVETY